MTAKVYVHTVVADGNGIPDGKELHGHKIKIIIGWEKKWTRKTLK